VTPTDEESLLRDATRSMLSLIAPAYKGDRLIPTAYTNTMREILDGLRRLGWTSPGEVPVDLRYLDDTVIYRNGLGDLFIVVAVARNVGDGSCEIIISSLDGGYQVGRVPLTDFIRDYESYGHRGGSVGQRCDSGVSGREDR